VGLLIYSVSGLTSPHKEIIMTQDQEQLIKDIDVRNNKLTQWEYDFIESIRWEEELTPKQDAVLNDIWEKVT
jgi:hypothetical protein